MKLELELTPVHVQELREVIDALPLFTTPRTKGYHGLILAILPQLPLESVAGPDTGADSTPAPLESREVAGGFSIAAYTPRGVSMLDSLERVLGKLPHGGSL
jgi:hypothetical protein